MPRPDCQALVAAAPNSDRRRSRSAICCSVKSAKLRNLAVRVGIGIEEIGAIDAAKLRPMQGRSGAVLRHHAARRCPERKPAKRRQRKSHRAYRKEKALIAMAKARNRKEHCHDNAKRLQYPSQPAIESITVAQEQKLPFDLLAFRVAIHRPRPNVRSPSIVGSATHQEGSNRQLSSTPAAWRSRCRSRYCRRRSSGRSPLRLEPAVAGGALAAFAHHHRDRAARHDDAGNLIAEIVVGLADLAADDARRIAVARIARSGLGADRNAP